MSPPRRDAVHRYFEYDVIEKTSKCSLCEARIKGKHTTNLKNHVSVKHPEEYFLLFNINKENALTATSREISNTEKLKILCLKLVTIHGRPFALLKDAAFQEIINITVPSNAKTNNININIIKGMITDKAYELRMKIASEVKNMMVSLKLDSATYMDRNFLGINLQYIKNGKIIIRNLAVLELLQRQTGELLKEKLLDILNEFMISTSQVYSITTDNGSNFKKMTRLLRTSENTNYEAFDDETSQNDNDEDDDDDDDENYEDDEDDEDERNLHAQNEVNELNSLLNFMGTELFQPREMLCAAHTLQLAIKDAISDNLGAQVAIQTARRAVKILRRPNMKNILKASNLKKPLIDCPTRWTSTYQMLVRLKSLQCICSSSEIMRIFSEDFWEEVENLIVCLKPLNDTTLSLQREQLTIGDFFIEWLNCKTHVEAIHTSFGDSLAKAIKARELNLLNKHVVLENLYLDGRLNVVLSDEECVKARLLLCQTNQQIQQIETQHIQQIETSISSEILITEFDVNIASTSRNSDTRSELEKMLQETERIRRLPSRSSENRFDGCLNNLRFEPRVPLGKNILSHWADKAGTTEPSLIKVANCVLAAPATQVSVERLFSSVKFILNPLRSNMNGRLLQDVMLIRSNHDLFE